MYEYEFFFCNNMYIIQCENLSFIGLFQMFIDDEINNFVEETKNYIDIIKNRLSMKLEQTQIQSIKITIL